MRKYDMILENNNPRPSLGRHRAGLSVLEFVGCFIAVVGGMWLGAIYLGVDLRRVAHEALTDTELLENVPEDWRPVAPEEEVVTREQLISTLREELSGLRNDISSLRDGEKADSGRGGSQSQKTEAGTSKVAEQESKEKTLTYWNRLIEIASGESALQNDAAIAFNDANAAKVFAVKSRVSRFAAKAVDAVPQDGVERSVVQFGRQLGLWYERGSELYDKAVHIWESTAAGSQARAQLNDEWKRAELQYRNETRLLDEKSSAVRSAAGRRFGQEFPEFVRTQIHTTPAMEAPGKAK
jgi:hypothetical protein